MKTKGAKSIRRNRHNKKTRALKTRKQHSKRSINRSTHKKGGKRRRMVQRGGGTGELVEAIINGNVDGVTRAITSVPATEKNSPFTIYTFKVNDQKKLRSRVDKDGDLDVVSVGDVVTILKIEHFNGKDFAEIKRTRDGSTGFIQRQYLSRNPPDTQLAARFPEFTIERTPLYLACRSGNPRPDIVKLLLDNGFTPNVKNGIMGNESTPLHGVVQSIKERHLQNRIDDKYLNDIVKILILLRPVILNLKSIVNRGGLTAFQEFTGDYEGGDTYAGNGGLYGKLRTEFPAKFETVTQIYNLLTPASMLPPPPPPPAAAAAAVYASPHPAPHSAPSHLYVAPAHLQTRHSLLPVHSPPAAAAAAVSPHVSTWQYYNGNAWVSFSHDVNMCIQDNMADGNARHSIFTCDNYSFNMHVTGNSTVTFDSKSYFIRRLAAHQTWFGDIFGFEEETNPELNFDKVKQNVKLVNSNGEVVFTTPNGITLHAGLFRMYSIQILTREMSSSPPHSIAPSGGLVYSTMNGDVKRFHQNPLLADSLFQVAGQFNMLEMVRPEVTPSMGITIYKDDHTQGPACAMACPAGTLFRNYFVNDHGQDTPEHQLNGLEDAHALIKGSLGHGYQSSGQTSPHMFWTMRNGYCFPTSEHTLAAVCGFLQPHLKENRRSFMDVIKYGIQWNTQVGLNAEQRVNQIYCSALPISYYADMMGIDEEEAAAKMTNFATVVLDAAYEATLAAGALLSLHRGKRVKVFLTLVGGGAFGNPPEWIRESIRKACHKFSAYPLDVIMVDFEPDKGYVEPFTQASAKLVPPPYDISLPAERYKWQWESNDGKRFNNFDYKQSTELEDEYRKNPGVPRYLLEPEWWFDFNTMTQTNKRTEYKRRIQRILK
jgi:hypothetical protein